MSTTKSINIMKHAYIIHLHYPNCKFNMPYLFTSEKEAYLYGERTFRVDENLIDYEVEKIHKPYNFYKLK